VHKIACNHLITVDMQLTPLTSSETAWCWYAMDYSEGSDGAVDKLAVRFKTKDTAEDFKKKFEDCQKVISERSTDHDQTKEDSKGPTDEKTLCDKVLVEGVSRDSNGTGSTWRDNVADYPEQDDNEKYYEEDYDEEDNDAPMFMADADLSIQDEDGVWKKYDNIVFKILYDDELYGARIVASAANSDDQQADICDHLIAMQTDLSDDLSWSALDYASQPPVKRKFKICFHDKPTENDFKDYFAQGKDFAVQCELMENAGDEIDPSQLYYGTGGDE